MGAILPFSLASAVPRQPWGARYRAYLTKMAQSAITAVRTETKETEEAAGTAITKYKAKVSWKWRG